MQGETKTNAHLWSDLVDRHDRLGHDRRLEHENDGSVGSVKIGTK